MAGSVTNSCFEEGGLTAINMAWQADSSGDVNGAGAMAGIYGKVKSVLAIPDSGVSSGYDVKLYDGNSIDLLNGLGANLVDAPENTANRFKPLMAVSSGEIVLANDDLELNVSNAGNDPLGRVVLILD